MFETGSVGLAETQLLFFTPDHEIFSVVIFSLLLIQEGHLSVSRERMCTNTD